MTDAPRPRRSVAACSRSASQPRPIAAANGVDRRPSHGDSPQKEGKGDQEEGDCPRVQSPGAALGTVPEVWGLSLGMEDFHAAGPSDLL